MIRALSDAGSSVVEVPFPFVVHACRRYNLIVRDDWFLRRLVLRVLKNKLRKWCHLIMDSCLGDRVRQARETHSIYAKRKGALSPLGAL